MCVALQRDMRNHLRLAVLLPLIAACGGSVADDANDNKADGSQTTDGTGTGTGTKTGTGTDPSYDLDVCTGQQHLLLEGVTHGDGSPAADGAVDYMELRLQYEGGIAGEPQMIAAAGTACATGPDTDKCKEDLAAFRSEAGWKPFSFGMEPPSHRYLVYTSGDTVGSVKTLNELREFVSPVENVKDAALLVVAAQQYRFVCDGTKNAKKTASGFTVRVQSGDTCGAGAHLDEHTIDVATDGRTTVTSTKRIKDGDPHCAIGRRPEGLVANDDCEDATDAVGRFFAEAANLEAASIVAFDRLADELTMLGAPRELVESALASREDEVRHARMTAKLAKRRGTEPKSPVIAPATKRSALEIALENAVEGCVRETYGALVAHYQAGAANDAGIAAVMRTIADDETRHAGLAWDVAAWLEPLLSPTERAAVEGARARAIVELRSALEQEPAPELEHIAGMPAATRAVAMLDQLTATFMRPALAA